MDLWMEVAMRSHGKQALFWPISKREGCCEDELNVTVSLVLLKPPHCCTVVLRTPGYGWYLSYSERLLTLCDLCIGIIIMHPKWNCVQYIFEQFYAHGFCVLCTLSYMHTDDPDIFILCTFRHSFS